jgi:hypothetical protein
MMENDAPDEKMTPEKRLAREARLAQKNAVTARISETSRLVGFGIVAWVFAIHTSETKFAQVYVSNYEVWVNIAGILGMLAIVSDYLQYLCAYSSVKNSLTREDRNYSFNKNHLGYFLQGVFFGTKQVCAVLGSLLVVATFGLAVILN